MPDGKRLWRTASGSLVEDGHPDAVFLAYGVDDALEGDEKAARKPANKQVAKPANKAKG
jgi:hypothetical protein